jgi:hypothetical protein
LAGVAIAMTTKSRVGFPIAALLTSSIPAILIALLLFGDFPSRFDASDVEFKPGYGEATGASAGGGVPATGTGGNLGNSDESNSADRTQGS